VLHSQKVDTMLENSAKYSTLHLFKILIRIIKLKFLSQSQDYNNALIQTRCTMNVLQTKTVANDKTATKMNRMIPKILKLYDKER